MELHEDHNDFDVLDFGPAQVGPDRERSGPWGARPRRWLSRVLLGAVLVAGAWRIGSGQPHPASAGHPAGHRAGATVSPVQQLRPLGGASAHWDLFGRGAGGIVRIDLAHGTVTRVALPALPGQGTATTPDGDDAVLVADTGAAHPSALLSDGVVRRLPASIVAADLVLPGPERDDVWVPGGADGHLTLRQLGIDGRPTGLLVHLPADVALADIGPDGAGYLLVTRHDGVYQVRPRANRLITRGTVVAIGPTGWVTRTCIGSRCHLRLVDRRTGRQRAVRGSLPPGAGVGLISPDARYLAIRGLDPAGGPAIFALDLSSGTSQRVTTPPPADRSLEASTWSPDGRYLFSVASAGDLVVLDTVARRRYSLGPVSPQLTQVAASAGTPGVAFAEAHQAPPDRLVATSPLTGGGGV